MNVTVTCSSLTKHFNHRFQEKVNYNAIYSMEARVKGKGLFNYAWTLYQSPVNDFTSDLVEEVEYSEYVGNKHSHIQTLPSIL